jgi:hypothetical protein
MPALGFTKDMETGAYLACNQAFADSANKATPKEVIGLRILKYLMKKTAAHYVDEDRKALEMDEPYRFMKARRTQWAIPEDIIPPSLNSR